MSPEIDVALPWKCLPHLQSFSTRDHGFYIAIFAKLQFKTVCTITIDYVKKICRHVFIHCIYTATPFYVHRYNSHISITFKPPVS